MINYNILVKYNFNNARNLGKEISTKIYTNGYLNNEIKLFKANSYWDGKNANYYILYLPKAISRQFICINLDYKYIGIPSSASSSDYKIILGNLFQSEVGAQFSLIDNSIKGLNYNPKLQVSKNKITFKLPKSEFGIDSVRIEN